MSYNNFGYRSNRSQYDGGYNKQFGGYNSNRNGGNFQPSYNGKRKSHVKKIVKDGVLYLSGWKAGKRAGFRAFFISPAKNPVRKVSKTNKVWLSCKVSVENRTHGTTGLFPAWINEATHDVFCKGLGLMFRPSTGFISYMQKK